MTTIRRWSKPKSFSVGGTQQHLDDPDGPISRCTTLEVDVSCINFVVLHIVKLQNVDLWVNFQMNLSPEAQLRLKSGMRVGLVLKLRSRELNYSGLTIKQILETLLLSLCTRLNAHSYQWFFFAFDFFPLTSILISSCRCLCREIIPGRL